MRLIDAKDGHELAVLRGHRGCTNCVAFSPNGQRVASTSDDGSAKIWDLRTRQELLTLRGHRGGFWGVRFSPDGHRLITTGYDGTVKIWDALASPEARTLTASDTQVRSLAFSPDGHRLVTAAMDGLLKVWEVPSGRLLDDLAWTHRAGLGRLLQPRWFARRVRRGELGEQPMKRGEVFIRDAATGSVLLSPAGPQGASPGASRSVQTADGLRRGVAKSALPAKS